MRGVCRTHRLRLVRLERLGQLAGAILHPRAAALELAPVQASPRTADHVPHDRLLLQPVLLLRDEAFLEAFAQIRQRRGSWDGCHETLLKHLCLSQPPRAAQLTQMEGSLCPYLAAPKKSCMAFLPQGTRFA
jgi:hypothetical protein